MTALGTWVLVFLGLGAVLPVLQLTGRSMEKELRVFEAGAAKRMILPRLVAG